MNAPVELGALAPAITDDELLDVLCHSLYPGAKRESAAMVLAYCRALKLDPMQKPVHIVPMSVKTGMANKWGNDEYVTRDVVMPGIGLYRVQAARTGQYAGQDEPVLGPMRKLHYASVKREWVEVPGRDKKQPRDTVTEKMLDYPEWVQVTVYRMVGGFRAAYTAREYWLENYATAGRDSDAPNAMWERRTIGQLVKCAEAQALRKGFPEVGSQPTAEEMEGRVVIDADEAPPAPPPVMPRRLSDATAEQQALREAITPAATPAPEPVPVEPAPPAAAPTPPPPPPPAAPQGGEPATEGERKNVLVVAKHRGVALAGLLRDLGMGLNAETLEGLTKPQFKAIKERLK